jgi:hypothetical protein
VRDVCQRCPHTKTFPHRQGKNAQHVCLCM